MRWISVKSRVWPEEAIFKNTFKGGHVVKRQNKLNGKLELKRETVSLINSPAKSAVDGGTNYETKDCTSPLCMPSTCVPCEAEVVQLKG